MSAAHRALATVELISTIFSFLKEEDGKWKGPVSNLAVVNLVFFHASISVVWQEMDSFEPFCSLLTPAQQGNNVAPGSQGRLVDKGLDRFNLYSSKTKSLILGKPPSLIHDPCWAAYIAAHKGLANSLFPSLKSLFLHSADALSLLIAFSVGHYIQILSIHLDPTALAAEEERGSAVAFTSYLSQHSQELVTVQVVYPIDAQSIRNLAAIKSIRHVLLAIDSNEINMVEPILRVPILEVVQSSDALKAWARETMQKTSVKDLRSANWRSVRHGTLSTWRTLAVGGSAHFHATLAERVCRPPASEKRLLDVIALNHNGYLFVNHFLPFTPSLIMKYIAYRPKALVLKVEHPSWKPGTYVAGEAAERVRSDVGFQETRRLTDHLRASKFLVELHIMNIYFPSGSIILHMLDVLHALPQLATSHFVPALITPREQDAFEYPELACLCSIARHCPCLMDLAIPVNLDTTNPLPFLKSEIQFNVSKLRALSIYPTAAGLPSSSVATTMLLAKYLYHLFPALGSLTKAWIEGSAEFAFWNDVYLIISSFKFKHDTDNRSRIASGTS
ncbi:hypothetical protein NMY22_g14487 [Coprinellus aureogranulatus]|nr:hypothetical protein NMY22_g14487 [Coprinellus aureogranulatus]